jgi:hypothetical protein
MNNYQQRIQITQSDLLFIINLTYKCDIRQKGIKVQQMSDWTFLFMGMGPVPV